ncbi:MAG: PQQ-binding-like beta-propeller repeat protein, partial [Planctomycetota bacterium]
MRPGTNLLGVQAGGTLTDDAVYVGDGRFVACVDRSSGRPRWVVGWPGQWLSTAARGQRIQDRRGVLVLSDTAVTVFGPAQAVRPRMRNAAAINAVSQGVWCLDRTTGATRWRVFPEDLGEGFAGAQFVGEVVSAGPDVLAVGVRRVQNSGFVDAFVAGLDAGSGEVLWTRHLVSTAESGGAGTLPVVDPMVVSDGRLFVDDGLGVVACVDPDSGGLHWLRVLTTEPAAAGLADAPAELEPVGGDDQELVPAIRRALVNPSRVALRGRTGPALLPAGLLVAELAQAAADDAALLLDPATGQVRRRISADDAAWVRRARWFVPKSATTDTLATQGDSPSSLLVSAGPLWRIDGRDLSVVWRSERSGGDEAGDWPPAVDGSTVLHAMQGSLRRYSWATGEAGDGAGWAMGSRLLADRGEVFGVSAQGVNGMVSGRWGERRLRERIEDAATLRPRDAEPGLALAKLGVSLSRPELLLDGVTASLGALRPEARPDARSPDGAPLSTAEVDALLAEFGGDVARHPDLEQVVGESGGDAAASVVLELIERVAEAEALPPQVRRAAFDRVAAAVTGP